MSFGREEALALSLEVKYDSRKWLGNLNPQEGIYKVLKLGLSDLSSYGLGSLNLAQNGSWLIN